MNRRLKSFAGIDKDSNVSETLLQNLHEIHGRIREADAGILKDGHDI